MRSALSEKLLKPFVILSKGQKALAAVRIGCSVLTVCVIIATYILHHYPLRFHFAQIKTGHLDVAMGLYTSLRSSLTESVLSSGAANDVLPIDSGLSDSEITILTKYAQTQVANAPQQLVLGFKSWCTVSYATDFSDRTKVSKNVTKLCYNYHSTGIYDYRALLSENQLEIIIAYAYQDSATRDSHYEARVLSRQHRLSVMNIIYGISLAQQLALCIIGVAIYASGALKSGASQGWLHVTGVLALVSGVTMSVAIATVASDLNSTSKEIQRGMGDFGVCMAVGHLFLALAGLALTSTCVGMLSWVIPLWCSNPNPEKGGFDEEIVAGKAGESHFRTHSRLFDHVEDSLDSVEDPFRESHDHRQGSSSTNESSAGEGTPVKGSTWAHSENELRKLGEKLSRNASVRHFSSARKQKHVPSHLLLHKKDTHELLYGPNPFSNHQYPQSFAKPMDASTLSRAASLTYPTKSSTSTTLRTRHLSGEGPEVQFQDPEGTRDDMSILDDAEIKYLNSNRFMNHFPE